MTVSRLAALSGTTGPSADPAVAGAGVEIDAALTAAIGSGRGALAATFDAVQAGIARRVASPAVLRVGFQIHADVVAGAVGLLAIADPVIAGQVVGAGGDATGRTGAELHAVSVAVLLGIRATAEPATALLASRAGEATAAAVLVILVEIGADAVAVHGAAGTQAGPIAADPGRSAGGLAAGCGLGTGDPRRGGTSGRGSSSARRSTTLSRLAIRSRATAWR